MVSDVFVSTGSPGDACVAAGPMHYEIWKYCRSTSKVHALSTTDSQSAM